MGILKNAADTVYAFRFIRMMVMDWKSWDAYKEGIVDEEGKRNRNVKIDTDEKRSAYTPFVRLVANIKRLVAKLPGGAAGGLPWFVMGRTSTFTNEASPTCEHPWQPMQRDVTGRLATI